MAQAVRRDPLGHRDPPGEPLDRAVGGMPVHPRAGGTEKDRPRNSFTDVEIERPRRAWRDVLAVLAHDAQGPVGRVRRPNPGTDSPSELGRYSPSRASGS
jgi:hypothetical protein